MMQPLREAAHVPGLWINRLLNTRHLSRACTCSNISSQDKNLHEVHNRLTFYGKGPLSSFHNRYNSQVRDAMFSSRAKYFHHSSTVSANKKDFSPTEITELKYEEKAEETLESLSDFFEELQEVAPCSDDYDSGLGNGVLTVHFSGSDGTYVINKQKPNKQIWLSSPLTGPKRYDYCDGKWIYVRDGTGLHELLEEEVSEILGVKISLKNCKYYS